MKDKLNRREFLGHAGKVAGGIALGALPLVQAGCKSGGPTSPSQNVVVSLQFINHTKGDLGLKTYSGMSGQAFSVNINGLGFAGINPLRIAVRKAAATESMGELIGYTCTGEISLKYPQSSETWEAYLMSDEGGTAYDTIDDHMVDLGGSQLLHARNKTWHRKDEGATGTEEPITEALLEINEALHYPWKKYGSFIKTENEGTAVGYALVGGPAWPQSPGHWSSYYDVVQVNPELCIAYEDRLRWFISYLFAYSTLIDTSAPHEYIHTTICDMATGRLNSVGRALLAYVYVKDKYY